eukprot:SAG11_NODE_120_length_15879_cov_8.076933_3_plen_84_part_00
MPYICAHMLLLESLHLGPTAGHCARLASNLCRNHRTHLLELVLVNHAVVVHVVEPEIEVDRIVQRFTAERLPTARHGDRKPVQ